MGSGLTHAQDVERTRRIQVFLTWTGPAFVVLFFAGWGIVAGFLPALSSASSAQRIAELYRDHTDLMRVGLLIGMCASFLPLTFAIVVSLQMRRAEGRVPVLAITQFASGIVTAVVLIIPMLLFLGGSFRPERSPELTQLVNDLSYVMIIMPYPPLFGQLVPIAIGVLGDRRDVPVYPRWVGYFNLWAAVLLLPVTFLMFFKGGPLSWNGLIGFWIGAAAFGSWYPVMTVMTLRAVAQEAEELR